MSDVNLNFVVNNNDISFTVQPNDITFTPEVVDLTFTTGGFAFFPAGGAGNTQVTFNDNGSLGGNNNFTFNKNTSNVALTGNLNVIGITSLGDVSNVKITGGSSNYILKTDGTGNLSWTSSGAGVPGGANTYVQYNNAGTFGGSANFNYNSSTDIVSINNNTIAGNLTIQRAQEKVTNTTFLTTITFDILEQSIINFTNNCSANFTLDFRAGGLIAFNDAILTNQCMTFALAVTNGASAYYLTTVSIDGVTQSVKWLGGAPITGFINSKELYNFNIIKTASATYTVLGSRGVYS